MTEQSKEPQPSAPAKRQPETKFFWVPLIWFDPSKYDVVPYKTGDGFSVWRKLFSSGYRLVPETKAPDNVDEK